MAERVRREAADRGKGKYAIGRGRELRKMSAIARPYQVTV